jgi:soluble lytic murein transglycosylase-like protein
MSEPSEIEMYRRSFVADLKHELILRSVGDYQTPEENIESNDEKPNGNSGRRKDDSSFLDLIESSGKKYEIEIDLIRAIIEVESGGNPLAVSSAGAAGLMQLMPITAKELGVTDRFDPEQNIDSGTRYLRRLIDRFGSAELALWAYNAGPTAVESGRMPEETQEYVPRVLLLKNSLSRGLR